MTDAAPRKPKRPYLGFLFLAYAVGGAIYDYVSDSSSMDLVTRDIAFKGAVLHLILWGIAGLGLILWFYRSKEPEAGGP